MVESGRLESGYFGKPGIVGSNPTPSSLIQKDLLSKLNSLYVFVYLCVVEFFLAFFFYLFNEISLWFDGH